VLEIDSKIYNEIIKLINKKAEGDYWDYKQEWHSDNERLLLDILCFANTVHKKDCYLIIGVADNGDIIGLNKNSPNRKNQVTGEIQTFGFHPLRAGK
jgi:predicted HTH transcriptional regulator